METILIVEDDADIRDSLTDLLELRGYQVIAVADGRQGLDRLEAGLLPCLVILDLMLPVMSGWEFRQRQMADSRWSEIPTIVLSGINNALQQAQRLQAVAFISKPVNFESLYEIVDRYC